MGKQSKQRHATPLAELSADLPDELHALVEKRVDKDRRVKERRGGPPRRSLKESTSGTADKVDRDGARERRKTKRRQTSTRRTKARRRS